MSSAVEERKVVNEKVVGLLMGSMLRRVRRKYGVPREIKEGTDEWRVVGSSKAEGHRYDGRARRDGRRFRGPSDVGVTTSLLGVVSLDLEHEM